MQDESWEAAGRRLIETWLASIGPLGPAANPPVGEATDPLLHLQQFADLVAKSAARHQAAMDPEGDLHAAVVTLFDDLSTQISLLRGSLVEAPPLDWGALWGQALHPILGPWREVHGKSRRMLQAMNSVTEAGRCLQRMHLDVLARALDTCRARLREADGPAIDSVRGLFDWWVAVVDAAYRDAAFTDDYAEAFARAVNAASELKLAMRETETLWSGGTMSGDAPAPAPAAAHKPEPDAETLPPIKRRPAAAKPSPGTPKPSAPKRAPRGQTQTQTVSEKAPRKRTAAALAQAPQKRKAAAPKATPMASNPRRDEFDIGHIAPTRK